MPGNDIRVSPPQRCAFTRPRGGDFFAPALEPCGSPQEKHAVRASVVLATWRSPLAGHGAAAEAGYDRRCPYKPRRHSSVAGNLGERRLLTATFAQSGRMPIAVSAAMRPLSTHNVRIGLCSASRASANRTRAAAVSADMVSPE